MKWRARARRRWLRWLLSLGLQPTPKVSEDQELLTIYVVASTELLDSAASSAKMPELVAVMARNEAYRATKRRVSHRA